MPELIIKSLPLADGLRWFDAFKKGDPAAVERVRATFNPNHACFICDGPAGPDHDIFVSEDPKRSDLAIIAPLCQTCMSLPTQQRLNRARRMLAAMFPHVRRHDVRPVTQNILARLG